MLTFETPHLFTDAKVAVYHAWEDGYPLAGPAGDYRTAEPVAQCTANVSISHDLTYSPDAFAKWSNVDQYVKSSYTVSIDGKHTPWVDHLNEKLNHRTPFTSGESHLIVIIRIYNEETGDWSHLQFHHARIQSDSIGSDSFLTTAKTFLSQWLEQDHGNTSSKALPAMTPIIKGVVEWVHQGRVIPVLNYDPLTQVWTSTEENNFTDEETEIDYQYAYIGPDIAQPEIAHISYLGAYTTPANDPSPSETLDLHKIGWEWITALRIYDHTHATKLGVEPGAFHTFQLLGCPEPVTRDSSARSWQHPQLIFRYLMRRYVTITHGVIAIPSIEENTVPVPHLALPFRIATENGDNPATQNHGLTLLPHAGYLDGVVI